MVYRKSAKARAVISLVLALLMVSSIAWGDVWKNWDYKNKKRTLKVWARNGDKAFKDAVKAAVDNWNTGDNNGDWTLEEGTEADHDVDVGTGKLDGPGGTLAEATANDADKDGVAEGGVSITADSEENWGDGATKQNLERAIKHELGHAQRMDDTTKDGDLMKGTQGVADDNLTPSQHDKDEAKASHSAAATGWTTAPKKSLVAGTVETCFVVPENGVNFRLDKATSVLFIPLDPTNLTVTNVIWDPVTGIRADFIPDIEANHNEACFLDIHYNDGTDARFTGVLIINPVPAPVGLFPHANAGPDLQGYAGTPITLDGSGSYHDDPTCGDSLVYIWSFDTQPGLSGGFSQTQKLTMTLPEGVYSFQLEVEDIFGEKSVDTVTVTVLPYPPPGADCGNSSLQLRLTNPAGTDYHLYLTGTDSIIRSAAGDINGNGRLDIAAEVASLNLSKAHPTLGNVSLTLGSARPSIGLIEQRNPAIYWPVDSFFDITYLLFINGDLYSCDSDLIRCEGINMLPFDETVSFSGSSMVPLKDGMGNPTGWSAQILDWRPSAFSVSYINVENICVKADLALQDPEGIIYPCQPKGAAEIRHTDWSLEPGQPWFKDTTISATGLSGDCPLGTVEMTFGSGAAQSRGKISDGYDPIGPSYPAESFFDIFMECSVPGLTMSSLMHTCTRVRLQSVINGLPPSIGTEYLPNGSPEFIPLLDEDGNPTRWSLQLSRLTVIQPTRIYTSPPGFVKPAKWNLVSVPADPINPDPLAVFSGIDVANSSFQFWRNDLNGGGYQSYGALFGWLGPILRGTPYWFLESLATEDKTLSFDGYLNTSSFEIFIPVHATAPFWVMFGTPSEYIVPADNIHFRNLVKRGNVWLTWEEAYSDSDPTLRIVDSNAQAWSAAENRFMTVTPSAFIGEIHSFYPWWGYWLLVYDENELQILFPTDEF